jgi:endoglucanase
MKKTGSMLFIVTALLFVSYNISGQSSKQQTAAAVPFSKGVNFSNWFEFINNAKSIQFNRYVEQTFADVKSLGFDVIRLPLDFFLFTSTPDYVIDPLFFKFLDRAVDWAEKYQIYIILDNHPGNQPVVRNDYRNFLIPVWTQMAEHYKNRSEYVIYEILNEPNRIPDDDWGKMQGDVIDVIRKIDKDRWIVVSGIHTGDNPAEGLSSLPKYSDNKLLYTIHFYDPHVFTHQGAAWITPSLVSLAKVPFPYNRSRMPKTPNELRGTVWENVLKNYSGIGTTAALTKKIDQVADFMKQRNVPVFCGEFGVLMRNCLPEDRVRYYQFVREAFEARNIPWIIWDYYDPFGIFNPPGGMFAWQFSGDINVDLNVELVRALGLNPPPQIQREPLITGFNIYDDNFSKGSTLNVYSKQNTFNTYYTPSAEGEYAIHWGNINRRNDGIRIQFTLKDFTYLVQNGFALEIKAKTEKQILFEVKFYNFQDNINWHIGYSIDQKQLPPDGKWHTIRIPLRDMQLWGGWDEIKQRWLEPRGRTISWVNINAIDFTMVNEDGYVCEIYLDDIKIVR